MFLTANTCLHRCLLLGIYALGALGIVASGSSDGFRSDVEEGVFLPANSFSASCAIPRDEINPFTGQPFNDIQGSIEDENNFLRSYSDDTYLWYDEIVDRDPALYGSPLVYFDLLKTQALTASGQAKDRFHFTIPSDEWFQLAQSGVSAGYGATFVFLSTTPPREVVVAYTEPGSPATDPAVNLVRGERILKIDGVDVINDNTQAGIDLINTALFPGATGETHSFEVGDSGSSPLRTVSITSGNVTSAPVQNVKVIPTLSGPVGYLLFNDHIATAEQALIDAVNLLNVAPGINDLVLDMRYNGGGFLDIASELAYMIAGTVPTAGRNFETLQFNDKHPTTNPVTGQPLSPTPFHSTSLGFVDPTSAGQALPTLDLSRVYVLVGSGTCSASEAIINGLRGVGVEVILIGSTTCGKPYGFYARDNCSTTYFTIQFRGVNAMDFGDYTDGFSPLNTASNPGELIPGCSVADDFSNPLGDPVEARLAAALAYRDAPGTCPAVSGRPAGSLLRSARSSANTDVIMIKNPWLQNRILR
jgi:carboxyl-terminal processing protease